MLLLNQVPPPSESTSTWPTPRLADLVKPFCRVVATLGLAATIFGAPAQSATTPAADATEAHTFTNAGGKTIQAQIMGVTGESVSLKRDDGQTFNVAIKTFVDADQTYIWHWAVVDASKKLKPIFAFELTKTQEAPSDKPYKGSGSQTFKVKVTNTTALHVQKPVMQYIVLVNGNVHVADKLLDHHFGTFTPDEITPNGQGSFETAPVTWPGFGGKAIGRLVGLWVRVYDADHQLIQEWCSIPESKDRGPWIFPERGSRGSSSGGPNAKQPPGDNSAPASPDGTTGN